MNQQRDSTALGQRANSAQAGFWGGSGQVTTAPASVASSNNTYLMPTSPSKKQRHGSDSYRPVIARTCGQRPACLVNASVTYSGNNTIYAFGGFDQYTDEGLPSWSY